MPWLGIIGVIIGWGLSQFTDLLKIKLRRRKLKRALYQELAETGRWLATAKHVQEKSIQLSAHKALPEELQVPIPIHIYDNYFHELSIYLSEPERVAFNSIYSRVKRINSDAEILNSLFRACVNDKSQLEEFFTVLTQVYLQTTVSLKLASQLIDRRRRVDIDQDTDKRTSEGAQAEEKTRRLIKLGSTKTRTRYGNGKEKSRCDAVVAFEV